MQLTTSLLRSYNTIHYNAEYAQYLQDLRDYQNSQNQVDLYAEFTKIVGTSSAPLSCYDKALNGDSGCYLHVLAHLVDYTGGSSSSTATYTTSSGDTFSFGGSFISGSFIESNGLSASFVPLSKELSTSGKKCDGEDDLDAGGKVNKLAEAIASGDQAQIEKWTLQSDYIANGDGTYSLKTLKQKAIDLAYMLQKGLLSTIPDPTTGKSEMWYSLVNFTDGDMKKLTSTPPIEPVKPTIEEPVMDLAAPQPPEMPEYTDKIYDKPLAQWYTNLWYIMDGNSTSDEIYSIYDEQAEFDYFTVPNVPKTSTPDNNNYIIMPEEQAGNADWLQFAINNGLVRLSQATLKNDTNSTNIRWEGTEYSSTSDIYESQDETKIAKAEAEYQKTLTEIQAEDKQLEKH